MNPTPEQIITARQRAGDTAVQAAARVHSARYQTWLDWEAGRCKMPGAAWELYLLLTGQHDDMQVVKKTTAAAR